MVLIEIGNPYGLDKAFANQGLHSTPSFSEVGLSVVDKLEGQRQDNNKFVRSFVLHLSYNTGTLNRVTHTYGSFKLDSQYLMQF